MFSRFEQEAGGKLMVGTLCLLEVSRHGLLEMELLALLGEDSNYDVPEYEEGEEDFVLIKTEDAVNKGKLDLNVEKDEVEELTDKFSKLVNEAYIVKDKDEEKERKSELTELSAVG